MNEPHAIMGMAGVGFFGMLFIGFLAGWIAERSMNRDHGVLTNILVGIAGSFVGGTAASILGFQWYGFLGNLVIATLGAIAILWFFGKREAPAIRHQPVDPTPMNPDNRPGDEPQREPHLPPIYHTTGEGGASAPKGTATRKSATKKPAARKSTAKGKK